MVIHEIWSSHRDAVVRNRGGAALLFGFAVAIAVGTWFGTPGLDISLRVFLMLLALLTMVGCGIGYLFTGEDEAPPR